MREHHIVIRRAKVPKFCSHAMVCQPDLVVRSDQISNTVFFSFLIRNETQWVCCFRWELIILKAAMLWEVLCLSHKCHGCCIYWYQHVSILARKCDFTSRWKSLITESVTPVIREFRSSAPANDIAHTQWLEGVTRAVHRSLPWFFLQPVF